MKFEVTVITPVYNGAEFIEKCIVSVLSQKNIKVQHIVIDDGSTDGTPSILSKYNQVDVVENGVNVGQSRSRNSGIDRALGDYICFLDADDYFVHDNVLSQWINLSPSSDMIKAANVVNGNFDRPSHFFTESELGLFSSLNEAPHVLNATSCWQFIYRKSFLINSDVRFSHHLKQREDRLFFFEALTNAKNIYLSNEVYIDYIVRSESTMRTPDLNQLRQFNQHLKEILSILNKAELSINVIEYTIQYYINGIVNYWINILLSNRSSKVVEDYFNYLSDLSLRANISSERFLDILKKQTSEEVVCYIWLLLRKKDFIRIIKYLESKQFDFDSISSSIDLFVPKEQYLFENLLSAAFSTHQESIQSYDFSNYEVVIHIGLPKTGTSYIQKLFSLNRRSILDKENIYYPATGIENGKGARRHRTSGHAFLIQELIQDKAETLSKLYQEITLNCNDSTTIFLSCENVLSERFWNNGKVIDILRQTFTNIKFVVSVRNQLEWLNSYYSEMVTSPGIRYKGNFREFIDNTQRDYLFFDYLAEFLDCRSLRYTLLEYDLILKNTDYFFNKVFKKSIEVPVLPRKSDSNESKSASLVNFLSSLPKGHDISNESFKEIQSLELFIDDLPRVFYSREDVDYITSIFRESNINLKKNFKIDYSFQEYSPAKVSNLSDNVKQISEVVSLVLDQNHGGNNFHNERTLLESNYMSLLSELFSFGRLLRNITKVKNLRTLKNAFLIYYYVPVDFSFIYSNYPVARNSPTSLYLFLAENEFIAPNNKFCPERYLRINPDVADAKINPSIHYYRNGIFEGRSC